MAEKAGFITGANAKIKAFGVTLAYCSDVAYNITVQTIPIESMGQYELHSNEPVGYTVDGSFSVIRYTSRAKKSKVGYTATNGNSPKKIGSNTENLEQHLNPSKLLSSSTFDLEIHEKTNGDSDNQVFTIKNCRVTRRGMTLNKRGVMVDNYAFVAILAGDEDDSFNIGGSGFEDLAASSAPPATTE
jgi:hypothetical protein